MKSDIELKHDVEQELEWDPSVDAAGIGVEVHEGVVTLAGHLRSYAEKLDARNAAQRVEGVKAVVVELDVRLPNQNQRTDEQIANAARSVLLWNAGLGERSVHIAVEKGCVKLTGEVEWAYQAQAAEKAVEPLRGVRLVVNQLQVKHRPTPADVTCKIEAALTRHAQKEARNIHVRVEDGAVTLSGTVPSFEDKRIACNAAWAAAGVRRVVDQLSIARS
jgi:osmotically-inducible protein OsmY